MPAPFSLTWVPNGSDNADGQYKTKAIIMNAPPVEIENASFKGKMFLIHDTGNEPPNMKGTPSPDGKRRGVEMQIQGKFKKAVTSGEIKKCGIWAGGELKDQMKLGWIMKNVVEMCGKFARKKTEGRVNINMGNKTELPLLSWPLQQIFTYVVTPPGQEPPALGSAELGLLKWTFVSELPIDTESTYTFIYNTPYLDICSWELLKVPGVSPLSIQAILGDISGVSVIIYDLGVAGSHEDWRKGVLLEWFFARGTDGDPRLVQQDEREVEEEELASSRSAKTPLDEGSDDSEGSEHDGIA